MIFKGFLSGSFDSTPTLLPSVTPNDINIKSEPPHSSPSIDSKRKEHSQRPSCANTMFQRPFGTRERVLLIVIIILIIIVTVLALRSSIMHWEKPGKNITKIIQGRLSAIVLIRSAIVYLEYFFFVLRCRRGNARKKYFRFAPISFCLYFLVYLSSRLIASLEFEHMRTLNES